MSGVVEPGKVAEVAKPGGVAECNGYQYHRFN